MSERFLIRGRQAPVAIVVQADVTNLEEGERALKELESEAAEISHLLHLAGYDVYLLNTGRYSELSNLLVDADIRERLVVFHYCGHAREDFLGMTNDSGDPIRISAAGLSHEMHSNSKALRLVYINGCMSDTQEDDYRGVFALANFIGTKVEVPDYFAKDFAIKFYRQLVGQEAPYGEATVKSALESAWGRDISLRPGRIQQVIARPVEGSDPREVAAVDLPDIHFRLDDGPGLVASYVLGKWRRRNPTVVLVFAMAVLLAQTAFLFASHLWPVTSSPAFQAAFVYQPSCNTASHLQVAGGRLFDCPKEPEGGPLDGVAKTYGFWAEWGRGVGLGLCLVVICTMIYRRLPRDHPELFSPEARRWITLPINRKYIFLFCIGFVLTVLYHVWLAPGELSSMVATDVDEMPWLQQRWPRLHDLDAVWASFGTGHWASIVRSEIVDLDAEDSAFRALYSTPYLSYLGYSLLCYLAGVVPILVVILNGFAFASDHLRLRLKELQVQVRLTRDGYYTNNKRVSDQLRRVQRTMSGQFMRFSAALLLLTLFAAYEVFLGRPTTGFFAQIVAYLTTGMVVFGVFTVGQVWNTYRDALNRISDFVADIHDEEIRNRFGKFEQAIDAAVLPLSRLTLIVFSAALAIFAYLVVVLAQGTDWTVFTHRLPLERWVLDEVLGIIRSVFTK